MASVFARGLEAINAYASMVFVLQYQTSRSITGSRLVISSRPSLPGNDGRRLAFFDVSMPTVPGWKYPKMRPRFLLHDQTA